MKPSTHRIHEHVSRLQMHSGDRMPLPPPL
jgi:hypothetical protein